MERTKVKIRPAKVEGARGLFKWAVFGEYEKAGVKQFHPIGGYRFPTKRGALRYAEMLLEKPNGYDTEYVKGWGRTGHYPRRIRSHRKPTASTGGQGKYRG